jgi:endonuclease YncB( thermonuclease family)
MISKEYVVKRLEENDNEMVVRTEKHPGVYGRFIADIILADSDMTLNDELLQKGLAKVWK